MTDLKLLSVKEAGSVLGISLAGMRRTIQRGDLPVCRIGRRTLVDSRDIEALIEKRKSFADHRREPGNVKVAP